MKNDLQDKLGKNQIILENIVHLTKEEKQKVVLQLLKTRSERQLSSELEAQGINVPHSTIHDWKTLRQDNTGKNIHISLLEILRKLNACDPNDIEDWGRLEQIKEVIDRLLRDRGQK